jgi:hypothetical protein
VAAAAAGVVVLGNREQRGVERAQSEVITGATEHTEKEMYGSVYSVASVVNPSSAISIP